MSKWIEFKQDFSRELKTKVFFVIPKDGNPVIGIIKWYAAWRKYSFYPMANTVFEIQCLKDICAFIDKLMLERKLEKQKE